MVGSRSTQPQSVILAHPHRLIRDGIADILCQAGFNVIGRGETIRDLRHLAAQRTPNIFLLDWELTDAGEEAISSLKKEFENSVVVVLTRPQPPEAITSAIQAGASGFLSVDLSKEEFVNSLEMVSRGDLVVSREMAEYITRRFTADSRESSLVEALSDREREVLSLVAQGSTNREIAETLIITQNTVKVHLRNILDKLNLRNRQQAAAFAVQEGLVEEVSPQENHQERR
ncbi:MAG: response regulator transcription factor [Chloroflexi bacterium]|nr:response regulator transcription factor [Chloroflexota bacterium]